MIISIIIMKSMKWIPMNRKSKNDSSHFSLHSFPSSHFPAFILFIYPPRPRSYSLVRFPVRSLFFNYHSLRVLLAISHSHFPSSTRHFFHSPSIPFLHHKQTEQIDDWAMEIATKAKRRKAIKLSISTFNLARHRRSPSAINWIWR